MPLQARLKQLAALEERLRDTTVAFPKPWPDQSYWNAKLPVSQRLVRPAAAKSVKIRCAQALIDAAARLAQTKPEDTSVRVMAAVDMTDMWNSELCVFFDEDAFEEFQTRAAPEDTWTPLDGRSLAKELGLALPAGFAERGYRFRHVDETFDPPWVEEGETWLIGEVAPL